MNGVNPSQKKRHERNGLDEPHIPLDPGRLLTFQYKTTRNILSLVAVTFIVGWLLPFGAAAIDGVLTRDGIRLPSKRAIQQMEEYERRAEGYESTIRNVEAMLQERSRDGQYSQIPELVDSLDKLREAAASMRPPYAVSSFYDNTSTYYWIVSYLCLGLLIITLDSEFFRGCTFSRTAVIAVGCYTAWMSSNWFRNFAQVSSGRSVYSYVNFDVGRYSFFSQELRAIVFSAMVALVWQKAVALHQRTSSDLAKPLSSNTFEPQHSLVSDYIGKLYTQWQMTSALLAFSFFPWTYMYWYIIAGTFQEVGDKRYYASAVSFHAIWGATWLIATLPTLYAAQQWNSFCNRILAIAYKSGDKQNIESALNLIEAISPLHRRRAFLASIIAAISFVLPLLQTIF